MLLLLGCTEVSTASAWGVSTRNAGSASALEETRGRPSLEVICQSCEIEGQLKNIPEKRKLIQIETFFSQLGQVVN